MLTRSNAREHHFFVERAQCRTVNAAHDIRATCSWQTGPTAHVESVGVIAKVRCQHNKIPTDGWSTDRASERMLGQALGSHRCMRDRLFIATKNMFDRMDANGIRESLNHSLKLLQTDYVDLFQVHGIIAKPFRADNWRDFITDEVLETFMELRREGKVRYIGVTGYREEALSALIETGVFQVVMPQFNYFYRGAEWELVKLAQQYQVAVIPMRPLTGGLMQTMLNELLPGQQPLVNPFKVAMKYILQFDCVSTIPVGMRTVREVEENVRLVEELEREIGLGR